MVLSYFIVDATRTYYYRTFEKPISNFRLIQSSTMPISVDLRISELATGYVQFIQISDSRASPIMTVD